MIENELGVLGQFLCSCGVTAWHERYREWCMPMESGSCLCDLGLERPHGWDAHATGGYGSSTPSSSIVERMPASPSNLAIRSRLGSTDWSTSSISWVRSNSSRK